MSKNDKTKLNRHLPHRYPCSNPMFKSPCYPGKLLKSFCFCKTSIWTSQAFSASTGISELLEPEKTLRLSGLVWWNFWDQFFPRLPWTAWTFKVGGIPALWTASLALASMASTWRSTYPWISVWILWRGGRYPLRIHVSDWYICTYLNGWFFFWDQGRYIYIYIQSIHGSYGVSVYHHLISTPLFSQVPVDGHLEDFRISTCALMGASFLG